MNNLLENQYVSTTLAVFLVLYGGLAAPTLHSSLANLFTNPFFRLLVIFLIAYTSSKNHSIALISTIVLVFIVQGSYDLLDDDDTTTTTTVTTETTTAEQVNTTQIQQNISAQHKQLHKVMDEDLPNKPVYHWLFPVHEYSKSPYAAFPSCAVGEYSLV